MRALLILLIFASSGLRADTLEERAQRYLADLLRLDTTNPPGNETRVAEYLHKVAAAEGIRSEILGGDPARMNFIARLEGAGPEKPLLLMAHSDVVPADRSQWTVEPFAALTRDGFLYGRGAVDDKCLLAAELAVMVELKRRPVKPRRGVILLSEADEEAGSLGIQWLIDNAWPKIDAEFALNEGGQSMRTPRGRRVFQIQTSEKIPTRVILRAKGTAGHGSLPRADNPVVHLAKAVARLADADQPVRLNTTTRRYLRQVAGLPDFAWIGPYLKRIENRQTAVAAANELRRLDPELDAQLRTSVSPTMLEAGMKVNVIPNRAQAQVDVRRLPNESSEEVMERFRRIVQDPAVEITPAPGQTMPATEPSSLTTSLYGAMETVFRKLSPDGVVVPYMSRGATDGAFLRKKGMAVYGIPVFERDGTTSRAHGNDERISVENLAAGTRILLDVVDLAVK
jgi:acetylornithine deacetylase/succinyl-diaminopimelate desuccinylase-like protein